jgi:hypothetical protein
LYPREVFRVVRHDDRAEAARMCRDQQIVGTDQSAALLQVGANLRVVIGRVLRPVEYRQMTRQPIDRGLVGLLFRGKLNAIEQLGVRHRRRHLLRQRNGLNARRQRVGAATQQKNAGVGVELRRPTCG